jgi:hypothetical protein
MLNQITPLFTLIFVFSILGVTKLIFSFIRNLTLTPPEPFEISKFDSVIYGLFFSYIITYLLYS